MLTRLKVLDVEVEGVVGMSGLELDRSARESRVVFVAYAVVLAKAEAFGYLGRVLVEAGHGEKPEA